MSTRPNITVAFSSATNGGSIPVDNGGAAMYVDGTFVGTIALQARPAGTSVNFQNVTTLTAPGIAASAVMPGSWEYRLACTAYTSGTANCILLVSNQEGGG